jgi:hypothetical protein
MNNRLLLKLVVLVGVVLLLFSGMVGLARRSQGLAVPSISGAWESIFDFLAGTRSLRPGDVPSGAGSGCFVTAGLPAQLQIAAASTCSFVVPNAVRVVKFEAASPSGTAEIELTYPNSVSQPTAVEPGTSFSVKVPYHGSRLSITCVQACALDFPS